MTPSLSETDPMRQFCGGQHRVLGALTVPVPRLPTRDYTGSNLALSNAEHSTELSLDTKNSEIRDRMFSRSRRHDNECIFHRFLVSAPSLCLRVRALQDALQGWTGGKGPFRAKPSLRSRVKRTLTASETAHRYCSHYLFLIHSFPCQVRSLMTDNSRSATK